jgi:hypothetical protein
VFACKLILRPPAQHPCTSPSLRRRSHFLPASVSRIQPRVACPKARPPPLKPVYRGSSLGVVQRSSSPDNPACVLSPRVDPKTVAFGSREPSRLHLPSLSFLPTSTACSTHRAAGLLHPAASHEVRQVLGSATHLRRPLSDARSQLQHTLPFRPKPTRHHALLGLAGDPTVSVAAEAATDPAHHLAPSSGHRSDHHQPPSAPGGLPDRQADRQGAGWRTLFQREPPSPLAQYPPKRFPRRQPRYVTAARAPSPLATATPADQRSAACRRPNLGALIHRRVRCLGRCCHRLRPDAPMGFALDRARSSCLTTGLTRFRGTPWWRYSSSRPREFTGEPAARITAEGRRDQPLPPAGPVRPRRASASACRLPC